MNKGRKKLGEVPFTRKKRTVKLSKSNFRSFSDGTKKQFYQAIVDLLEDMIDLDQYTVDSEIDYQLKESEGKLKSDFEKLRAFEPDPRSKGFAIGLY
jgi:hypothetical protein